MLNTIMALRCLGYGKTSPEFSKALREFRDLEVHDGPHIRVQPCTSAIWDTSWALHALARGNGDQEAVRKAADWLLSKQVFTGGDWQVNNPAGKPGAWAFEFDNPIYPDTDDTSSVLMSLYFAGRRDDPGFSAAVKWMHSMQNPDGGWGAFDRNINLEFLEHLPWADHNALLDPSTADLTGRIIEMFGYIGSHKNERFMGRAIQFLKKSQEADGSWFGRWGVNYIYGTWQVLVGLKAAGVDMREGWVQRAATWFRTVQNPDGRRAPHGFRPPARRRVAAAQPAHRRRLGRVRAHGHGLPPRLLSRLHDVSPLFPPPGAPGRARRPRSPGAPSRDRPLRARGRRQ
jgi:squalene-hopene/tetraprenyl-beta-curcumene cyclase